MSGEFLLVLIVAGAYLAAHWAFEWLGQRYMLVSGAEYLLLGILLGPQVSGVLHASVLDASAGLSSRDFERYRQPTGIARPNTANTATTPCSSCSATSHCTISFTRIASRSCS